MAYPYRYFPNIELIGLAGAAILENLAKDEVHEFVERHGLGNIQPDAWYPVDSFIHVFEDWYNAGENLTQRLISSGMAVLDMVAPALPADINSWPLVQQLSVIEVIHQTSYRGGLPGEFIVEQLDDNHLRYRASVPWPDDFNYGLVYGIARHFLAKNYVFNLQFDPDFLRQDDGGEFTVLILEWKPRGQ